MVNRTNNVNGNENVVLKTNYINNFNDKYERSRKVERIADRLMEMLGAAIESRPFLCKCALKLSEERIWSNAEQAMTGRNKMGLFIFLCKRDGV